MTINHGLKKQQLELIKDIFKGFSGRIDKVSLFGSRAIGCYKNYSDIDLVIYGNISDKDINSLWTHFYESSIPYKIDIKAYHLITYQPLKNHIDRYGKMLLSKRQLISN